MATLNKATLFPKKLETEIFNKVKGHSSLAKLSASEALPFTGKDIFAFNFSSDIGIVAEGGAKPVGDAAIATVTMQPVKVVYGMRVSDEFMYASEEDRVNILAAFAEGFAARLGAGLDLMAMHGINPADKVESALIGNNCFDKKVTGNKVSYTAASADANIDAAIAAVEAAEYTVNGAAISPTMRGALAALTANGARKYPEFGFGGVPATLGAMGLDVNATVGVKSTVATKTDHAIVGDFRNCFRWGIAKELPLTVIQYGDPDNAGRDLAGHNEVYIRSEAYIGWAIMDENAFARVEA